MAAFEPGNIIDDAQFWDANAMGVAEIQNFLNSKVSGCAAGFTCLKNYSETTRTIAATPMCSQYNGAANESAATIIFKVAQTCGVSPKVLLVILQKEQGLVTHTSPSAGRFRSAMGAGCPDTAACDSQLLRLLQPGALRRLPAEALHAAPGNRSGHGLRHPLRSAYPVGKTTAILYHPNATAARAPSTSRTRPRTRSTSTRRTPRTPRRCDEQRYRRRCSSYGNRNFYATTRLVRARATGLPVGIYFRDYYLANSSGWATRRAR